MYEAHRTEGVLCQFLDVIAIQIENLKKYLHLKIIFLGVNYIDFFGWERDQVSQTQTTNIK